MKNLLQTILAVFSALLWYQLMTLIILFIFKDDYFKVVADSNFFKLLSVVSTIITILTGLAILKNFGSDIIGFTIAKPFWKFLSLQNYLYLDSDSKFAKIPNGDCKNFLFLFHKYLLKLGVTTSGYRTVLTSSQIPASKSIPSEVVKSAIFENIYDICTCSQTCEKVEIFVTDFFKKSGKNLEGKDIKFLQLAILVILGYKLDDLEFDFIHSYFVESLNGNNILLGGGLSENQISGVADKWSKLFTFNNVQLLNEQIDSYQINTPKKLYFFIKQLN
jgi:hypothetical protein